MTSLPSLLAGSGALLMYICVGTFILYITGDYNAFHSAFFGAIAVDLPDFRLPAWSIEFLNVLSRVFSSDFDLNPRLLFEASLSVQVLCTTLVIMQRTINIVFGMRARRRRNESAETPPETSSSSSSSVEAVGSKV